PPDRAAWRIDVDPGTPGAVLSPLELSNAAVSTSSGAEQFVTLGGVRYSHIVDPRTGEALRVGRAVVAIAPDGATADALATAISVLGPDEGLRLADAEPGAAALVLEAADGRVARAASSRWPARGWASRVRRDPDQQ
ncbi:MAG TPA: FAD:protein FMN transferase, partial [Vicinamibacterales bacterium]|nr:FAD:protein FMN transferase [Vicinamibacterales bacterium]